MNITITYGKGSGKTELAAFDSALWDAGIANYNLITLSSVIPPNSKIIVKKLNNNDKEIGNKLYVVLSKCTETLIDKTAYAGLGWITKEDESGIFMEECGGNEIEIKSKINDSLESVIKYRKGNYESINYKIEKIKCIDKPVCAIVSAIYKSEKWNI